MNTLIELYDERPIENVLGVDVFKPQRVVYLCPQEVAQSKERQQEIKDYFKFRGNDVEIIFLESSMYYTSKVKNQLEKVVEKYPDCAIDITGGTDAVLFAAGMLCAQSDIPAFTYSRTKNRFFNISNAPFADNLRCDSIYTLDDFFKMAGGSAAKGRVDNSLLLEYEQYIDGFYTIYMKYRKDWVKITKWFCNVSNSDKNGRHSLHIKAKYNVKGERGSSIAANEKLLKDVEKLGFIKDLKIVSGSSVEFTFLDEQVRFWLRDTGSVLELYVWKCCRDAGIFSDVRCSTIIDWKDSEKSDKVSNEIDVIALKGLVPVFISCKTCAADTDALNELTIIRDRFGGKCAEAVIVTAETCRNITRHRASELNITVIDLEDLKKGALTARLTATASK